MNSNVNIGLIGCGSRLRYVAHCLQKADTEKRIRIRALHDPDAEMIRKTQESLGLQDASNCTVYESDEALIADPQLDWVFIGSPNCSHARQAILALNAGKHVFCEKPLATTIDDCLAIDRAARDARARGQVFAFGLVLRYSAHYQRIKELLASGALGRVMSFEFNETLGFNHGGFFFGDWRRERSVSGPVILEKCCHDFDLANWLIESLPVRTASFGGTSFFTPENAGIVERLGTNERGLKAYHSYRGGIQKHNAFDGGADILDHQVAILEYANGVRATFHFNANAAIDERRFYICGTEGTLQANLATSILEWRPIGWNTERQTLDTKALDSDGHGGGDVMMARSLVETLLRGEPPLASAREGVTSAIVALAIDQAQREGRIIDLREDWKAAGIEP